MVRNSFFLMMIAFLLAGCTTGLGTPVPRISSATRIPRKTYPAGATPPAPHIPTNPPNTTFRRQCLQLEPKDVPLKDVSAGVVFFFPDLFDIQTGKKYRIPSQQAKSDHYGWGQVSPDRKKYAYLEEVVNNQNEIINHILWVVDAHASLLSKFLLNQKDWLGIPRWLDNERLIIDTAKTLDDGSILLVNPFTHEERIIANELPMLDTYNGVNMPVWRVEYSPDLEWVAYLNPDSIIVRDIVTKQTLWQSTGGDGGKPVWSPDGQQVAVISLDDGQLYLVSRSGQTKSVLDKKHLNQIQSPSWSPDGHYIAFWNSDMERSNYSLMVYETQTGNVIDYCIKNPYHGTPLWSPNSKVIIVNQDIDTGSILLDLRKNAAYKIQEISSTKILEWMNSLP